MMKPLELAVGAVVAIAIAATIADTASGDTPPRKEAGMTIRLAEPDPAGRPQIAGVRYARGAIEKTCGARTFRLTTGSGKGACASGVALAECTDGAGNTARLYCESGCGLTTGSAQCQQG